MPSIKQSQSVDRSKLEAAAPSENIGMATPPPESRYGVSRFFRCALPSAISGLDGNIRQFYGTAGVLPQQRTMPIAAQAGSTKGASGAAGAPGASGKSGRDGADLHRVDIPLSVAFTNSTQATGLVALGRTTSLLSVNVPSACRVRLYSTTTARDADKTRDASPLAAVPDGLVFDLNLSSAFAGGFPFLWICKPLAPGADMRTAADGQLAYTVDTYGPVTGVGWTGLHIIAPAPSGNDPTNLFGDSYNEWDFTSPVVVAGKLVRVTSSPFYNTQAWFMNGASGPRVGSIGNTTTGIPAGTSSQAFVPASATHVRGYAKSGNFADSFESAEVATTISTPPLTLVFTVLREEV